MASVDNVNVVGPVITSHVFITAGISGTDGHLRNDTSCFEYTEYTNPYTRYMRVLSSIIQVSTFLVTVCLVCKKELPMKKCNL